MLSDSEDRRSSADADEPASEDSVLHGSSARGASMASPRTTAPSYFIEFSLNSFTSFVHVIEFHFLYDPCLGLNLNDCAVSSAENEYFIENLRM